MIRKLVITWLSLVIVRLITGETLRTFRMMEKIWTKRTKIKSHLEFNITCDNCDLLPIFTLQKWETYLTSKAAKLLVLE